MQDSGVLMQASTFVGTNWTSLAGGDARFSAGVSSDGSLWVGGNLPRKLLGQDCPATPPDQSLVRVAGNTKWRQVSGDFLSVAGILQDGTLWMQDLAQAREAERPSLYADWLAVSHFGGHTTALAADGTLSTWSPPYRSSLGLPEPKDRPLASVNILDSK